MGRCARVWLLAWIVAAGAGCDGCGDEPSGAVLATLVQMQGRGVRRDFAARREQWEQAELSAQFRLGDGVRTEVPSSAILRIWDGSQLQVQPGTTVRFAVMGAGAEQQGIDVLTGEALLRAGGSDLALRTHVGLAVITAGSHVLLTRDGQALELRVEVGEAHFRSAGGDDVTVGAGDSVRLEVGMAVLRPPSGSADGGTAAPSEAPSPDAGAKDAAVADADPTADPTNAREDGTTPGPDYANFGVRAGETFVVHAPEVPVAIAFAFDHKCKAEGAVELVRGKQRARGKGRGNLLLPKGSRAYVVRCADARGQLGKVVARGTVHVLRDAGTRRLPPRAPTSLVEADGRNYTIYYQNQLPEVRVRWPNAPQAASYTLEVDGEARSVKAPEHLFRSGGLRDGVHRLTFAAGARRSRTATIEIRFDNAAPTASLSSPGDRSFEPGATVQIEGVALPSWKVSVLGGTIEEDEGNRFQGQVVTSADRPDIAVRLSHPRLGTHYYLRRAASSR